MKKYYIYYTIQQCCLITEAKNKTEAKKLFLKGKGEDVESSINIDDSKILKIEKV